MGLSEGVGSNGVSGGGGGRGVESPSSTELYEEGVSGGGGGGELSTDEEYGETGKAGSDTTIGAARGTRVTVTCRDSGSGAP
jgi:hypothetical protein